MRDTWKLSEQALVSPVPSFTVDQVLVEYDGPQIVTLVPRQEGHHESVPHARYLGIAADDGEGVVRWILAAITNTELKALIDGAATLRDALLKAQVFVLDADHDWVSLSVWSCDGNQLDDESLPERGALLPRLSREELAETVHDPELCIDGPTVGDRGVMFRALANILDVFQRFGDAITASLSPNDHKSSGPVRAEVTEKTALYLASAGAGSLVLKVRPADTATYRTVAEQLEELVRIDDDPDALAEVLTRLGPRARGRYSELLTCLAKHDLQLLARRPGGAAFLSASIASRVLTALPLSMASETRQMNATGYFIAFDRMKAGSFVFYDERRDETYSGAVHSDVMETNKGVTVGDEARYTVTLDIATVFMSSTERAKQTYTLRNITHIPRVMS